jgi:hypothetical protein
MRHFGLQTCKIPRILGGQQRLSHSDDYFIPLSGRNSLPYIDIWNHSDLELNYFPHIFFTSDAPWDPSVLDDQFFVADLVIGADDQPPDFASDEVNNYGEIHSSEWSIHSTISSLCTHPESMFDTLNAYVDNTILLVHANHMTPKHTTSIDYRLILD